MPRMMTAVSDNFSQSACHIFCEMMGVSNGSNCSQDPLLVAFGNPLLDMTAVVADKRLHVRFSLPTDGQLEVSEEQLELFSLVQDQYEVQYTAGGCSLNTCRVFSWVLDQQKCAVFIGGIGQDEDAERLIRIICNSGVVTRLLEVSTESTGRCVALVLGAERCLCADVGAANYCPPEHVFHNPDAEAAELQPRVTEMLTAQLLYVEGYFITHSFDTALMVAKFAKAKKKTLVFNLCGSYVCENHPSELKGLLPYVDILIGFVEEYKTLEKHVDLPGLASSQPAGQPSIVTSLPCILQAVNKPNLEKKLSGNGFSPDDLGACSLQGPELPADARKESVVTNGSPDSECSNTSNYFDNSEVLYDTDDPVSPSVENNILSVPSKPRRRSEKRSTSSYDSMRCQRSSSVVNRLDTTSSDESESFFRDKVVIMTQGALPLLYVAGDGVVKEKQIAPLSPDSIVDTTGAGDSFVGGFLACLSQGRSLEDCIEGGVWAARQILQQKGCSVPDQSANYL
ncbi:Carbohydrate kinase PfkB [Trinorchestia longiramus]|nr:Carbohydrate kinase PfkB [Trinorchestia longiramus]